LNWEELATALQELIDAQVRLIPLVNRINSLPVEQIVATGH
jgi:hypothetical protein